MRIFKGLMIFLLLFVLGCGNSDNESSEVSLSKEVVALADSLEMMRKQHAAMVGFHTHKQGDDLAYAAHQDPNKKRRMAKYAAKNRVLKQQAARSHAERVAEILNQD